MKSEENEVDLLSIDEHEIEGQDDHYIDGAESDSEGFDSHGSNEIAYRDIENTVDESEQIETHDSLTTAHLPVAVLNIVLDISKRDCISQKSVALALFTALSSVFFEKIQICQKRNDPSTVIICVVSPMVLTAVQNTRKSSFKRILRTLLQSHHFVNPSSEGELFDFRTLIVDARRDFSGSKIRLLRGGETGRIEAIFSGDSFERNGDTLNPETQPFFVSIDEIGLQSVVKNVANASAISPYTLLTPSPANCLSNDIPIDVSSIKAISQIFARISNTVNKLEANSPLSLHFSAEAQHFYFEFVDELKWNLKQSMEHPSLKAHLDAFDELFCKIALLLFLCERAASGRQITAECEIDLIAAKRARAWCEILETPARTIFQNLVSVNSLENLILQKIADGLLGETFTRRDITRAQWSNLKSSSEVQKALDNLVEDGKLKIVPQEGKGRRTIRYAALDIEEVESTPAGKRGGWENK